MNSWQELYWSFTEYLILPFIIHPHLEDHVKRRCSRFSSDTSSSCNVSGLWTVWSFKGTVTYIPNLILFLVYTGSEMAETNYLYTTEIFITVRLFTHALPRKQPLLTALLHELATISTIHFSPVPESTFSTFKSPYIPEWSLYIVAQSTQTLNILACTRILVVSVTASAVTKHLSPMYQHLWNDLAQVNFWLNSTSLQLQEPCTETKRPLLSLVWSLTDCLGFKTSVYRR